MLEEARIDTAEEVRREPSWLKAIALVSSTLNRIAAAFAAILLTLMVTLILVEIVLRFFSRSTFMADALVGHGVAAITFLALGWALEQGTMIRISVITQRLRPAGRFCLGLLSILAAEVLVLWLMYFEWRAVSRLWARGTTSEHHLPIPLWIPEFFFFVGLTLLAIQLVVMFFKLVVLRQQNEATLRI